MPRAVPKSAAHDRLRAIVALGCAALVLALTIFAASPGAHQWLHAEKHTACKTHPHSAVPPAAETDGCAIVLFANGVSLPVAPLAVLPPREVARSVSSVPASDIFLVSPRYLHQPERGPPSDRTS